MHALTCQLRNILLLLLVSGEIPAELENGSVSNTLRLTVDAKYCKSAKPSRLWQRLCREHGTS